MASNTLEDKLVKSQLPGATTAMTVAQATTNAYAGVVASQLDTSGKNIAHYAVKNTGANTMTAKLQGRIKDAAGGASDWVDITSPAAADVAAAAQGIFLLTACPWSEVRVAVISKVADTPGAALVFGVSKVI